MKEYYGLYLENTVDKNFKQVNIQLNQFNYYYPDYFGGGGTLLHSAVYRNFVGYTELLLKDGFDPNMNNRRNKTPVSLAQDKGFLMKSLFSEDKKRDEDGKNEKEKENENEKGQMNVRSLSLRYDVCFSKQAVKDRV